ncbi:hypothetical protein BGZ65_003659, partial [Modicella reniformis]
MNAIATFVSLITLLTYVILNLACFLLKIGSAPNFRPSFRFFRWWTAFAGMVLSAVVMCFVDLGMSLLSGLMTSGLFILIHYWSPPKRWGDVTQSLMYHQVRKYLLRLDSRKDHVKFWRPQILLLVHHPRTEYHLIQFCNHLKKGALYVLGHVILGDLKDVLQEYRRQQSSWLKFVDVLHIKAFVNLSVADNVRIGARNLLIGTGLGGMRPNIVVLGAFNLQRYLREKQGQQQQELQQQEQQQQLEEHQHIQSPDTQKGAYALEPDMNIQNHILKIPVNLPIDNIRVEPPIGLTDYVSIIEDVLSLNKAVAIAYGFERLELPEDHRASWRLSNLKSSFLSSSLPPSLHKHGDTGKKKYIDLWPMQMSIAPSQFFDYAQQPTSGFTAFKRPPKDQGSSSPVFPTMAGESVASPEGQEVGGDYGTNRRPEANLTNFDTYAMVLQMGCILHMVPQWRDDYTLRVMVFVEYKNDVEEEEKRLRALLDNLRIPAEIKIMCLDGDSETYISLMEDFVGDPNVPDDLGSGQVDRQEEPSTASPIATVAQRPGTWNMNPNWQQRQLAEEEDEGDKSRTGTSFEETSRAQDGQRSSEQVGPYSGVARDHNLDPGKPLPFKTSHLTPHRRSTISHMDHPHHRQSPCPLKVDTTLALRSPLGYTAALSARPSSSQHRHYSSGSRGPRYRNISSGLTSPIESRLGTSVPLGGFMNFRIAVPLPRQFFDANEVNSESESESSSSEDDEVYDLVDNDWVH